MQQEKIRTHKKVALHTLGCRLNFSETGHIAQGFTQRGYQIVPFGEAADVCFINTCTVTDDADSSCRNLIRKAHRSSPEGKIVVAGCYAQMDPERIAKMQGVDLVLGTSEKYKVFDYLQEDQQTKIQIDKSTEFWGAATTPEDSRTRAFLKIQDGCNYVCSFCIIPFARGRSRAVSIAQAKRQAMELVRCGFKEIVLTGVNIGEYESSSGERLEYLVQELLQLEGLQRLRLSSVEPNTITDELLAVMKSSDKFMDHFHVPLQSGSDEILKSMRRKYDVGFYRETILKIKDAFPRAGIGGDIICGYPGETPAHFEQTYRLVEQLPFTHFHVFPYSRRQKTTAATMEEQIPHAIKKERVLQLRKLGEKKLQALADSMVGQSNVVLFERRNRQGAWQGHTTNFIKVVCESSEDLSNQTRWVRLVKCVNGILIGSL